MFKKKLPIILLSLLIIPVFSSLLRSGYFPMHDDMQAMRLLQMDKCVKDGQIPCRWVPDMGYGYGYPQFNYYAPLPYYFMESFHLLGFGYLDSVKIGFITSVVVSAFGMFLLGSSLWGSAGGFISALFYTYIPYRAVNMYVRGAVGEFWGMSFLPIILWSIRKVFEGERKAKLWLALSLAALLTSHNITTLIFIPVIVLWTVFLYFYHQGSPTLSLRKKAVSVLIGNIWGFLIASFFIIPAWFERKYVHIETLLQGYFNYLAHFVSIKQLLFSSYWGYGSSELGPYDDMSLSIGLIHWILPFVCLILLTILKRKKQYLKVVFFTLVGWLALFMTHSRSSLIWERVDIFSYLQFPWRFLILATFAFSVAAGAIGLTFPKKGKLPFLATTFLVIITLLFNASFFKPIKWIEITDKEKFFGGLWEKQQTISIFDYLPIYAKFPPAQRAPKEPETVSGQAEIVKGEKGTNWQNWKIKVLSDTSRIQLSLFYFPGWEVRVDDGEEVISYNNELGLITFSVDEGEHNIEAKLTDTPVRRYANLLTFTGIFAIPIFLRRSGIKK